MMHDNQIQNKYKNWNKHVAVLRFRAVLNLWSLTLILLKFVIPDFVMLLYNLPSLQPHSLDWTHFKITLLCPETESMGKLHSGQFLFFFLEKL